MNGTFNIIRMSSLDLLIECNPKQNPNKLFVVLKFMWKGKIPSIANTILRKKKKLEMST